MILPGTPRSALFRDLAVAASSGSGEIVEALACPALPQPQCPGSEKPPVEPREGSALAWGCHDLASPHCGDQEGRRPCPSDRVLRSLGCRQLGEQVPALAPSDPSEDLT